MTMTVRTVNRSGCGCDVGPPGKCSRCLYREQRTLGYHVRALQPSEWGGRLQQRRVVCADSGEASFDGKPFLFTTRRAAFAMKKKWQDYFGPRAASVHRVLRRRADAR